MFIRRVRSYKRQRNPIRTTWCVEIHQTHPDGDLCPSLCGVGAAIPAPLVT